jgi:DAK2 domain fusion protein YloV
VPSERRPAVDVTALDGRGFAKFLAAGAYFLRKYRSVLNDLNVFPVPDGDTGTNMYLTLRSASLAAGNGHGESLGKVAARAAEGSLMGARGNSGVITSQMLRGFAHHVRNRDQIDTFMMATAMREGVSAARNALVRPVEGTIISVADAAAEAAYHAALHETEFYRLLTSVLRTANDALDRTPEQLPILKEAGVVDAGGAGFVYFLEGILRFLPDDRVRATAFPRRPSGKGVFTPTQHVGENKYCTEFVVEAATIAPLELRKLLEPRGESLLVVGATPTLKVHVHTDDPERVQEIAGKHGTLTRVKVDDMERQHRTLVLDEHAPARSVVAVVPGDGFARIARELGAQVIVAGAKTPSVRDLLLAVNKCLSDDVVLFVNDANAVMPAREVPKLTDKRVVIVPTADVVEGIAGLFELQSLPNGSAQEGPLLDASRRVASARVFLAAKDSTIEGVSVRSGKPAGWYDGGLISGDSLSDVTRETLARMGAATGGLVTMYYGGAQRENGARKLAAEVQAAFPQSAVEYYYGGMKHAEYWLSLDE